MRDQAASGRRAEGGRRRSPLTVRDQLAELRGAAMRRSAERDELGVAGQGPLDLVLCSVDVRSAEFTQATFTQLGPSGTGRPAAAHRSPLRHGASSAARQRPSGRLSKASGIGDAGMYVLDVSAAGPRVGNESDV